MQIKQTSLFSQEKIRDLIRDSHSLTKVAHVQGGLSNSNFLMTELQRAAENANAYHNSDLPFYNYFSGRERLEEVNSRMLGYQLDFSNIFESISKVSGYERYCLILNHIECYSEQLNASVYQDFTSILIESIGEPVGGIDYYAFIGNNDLSPPGLHVDHDMTFIFHIGPNSKTLLIWEDYFDKAQLKSHNMLSESALEEHKDSAKVITLAPNDLLFIPRDVPHYVIYDGPSVMFGITLFPFYTDYIWFLDKGQSKLENTRFMTAHDTEIRDNLFLKYPAFKKPEALPIEPLWPLAMTFATTPITNDLRFNAGTNRFTLKPIYRAVELNAKK